MMHRLGVLAAAAVLAAGCSGADDDNPAVTAATTAVNVTQQLLTEDEVEARRAFVRTADVICKRALERKPPQEPKTQEEVSALVAAAVETQAELIRRLRELPLPEGSTGLVEDWLDQKERVADLTRVLGNAILSRDTQSLPEASTQAIEAVQRADDIARLIGLQVCRDAKIVDLRTRVVPRGETTPTVPGGAGQEILPGVPPATSPTPTTTG